MSELLDTFIGESRENLESASQELITLQTNGYDAKAVDTIFRDIHTIKGSSDLFDIKPLTRLAHASEDLLDCLRASEIPFSDELGDVLLESFDQISTFFDELEAGTHQLSQWEGVSAELAGRLRNFMTTTAAPSGNEATQPVENAVEAPAGIAAPVAALPETAANWLSSMSDTARLTLFFKSQESTGLHYFHYTPDADCFFRGEDPFNVSLATPGFITHTITRKSHVEGPEDVFLCHLDILLLSSADWDSLSSHFAYYEGQYEHTQISAEQVYQQCAPLISQILNEEEVETLAQALENEGPEQIARICNFVCASTNPDSAVWQFCAGIERLTENPAMLSAFCQCLFATPDTAQTEETPVADDVSEESIAEAAPTQPAESEGLSENALAMLKQQETVLIRLIDGRGNQGALASINLIVSRILNLDIVDRTPEDLLRVIASEGEQNDSQEAPDATDIQAPAVADTEAPVASEQAAAINDDSANANKPVAEATQAEPAEAKPEPVSETSAKPAERQVPRTLKVNQEKIDYLMDLVGELTVAKNSLPYLARQAEEDGGSRKLSKQIKSHFTIVNRLTEELQSAVLQIRMVPVSHVFQRYPRLVRDLARKLNKKIELEMQGEDTEFDKNLIESLSEPLIHLLRNSIDHGIEAPADRLAAGKNESGCIQLIATPQDDNVVIEIRDDGKGIDPAKIKMLAYQKGVITESQLESINDEEALQLIFAPGFSTSEQVSDLSGRGVGMDAVKTMVTQAGGHIEMQSEVGKGTQFRLVLPQTMSVNRVMMFEVNEQMFGVSMDSVVETLKVRPDEIQQIKNHQVLVIRDKLVPLHDLREYLGFELQTQNVEEQSILVVNTGNGDMGLVIDKFHEGIDVIQKPLEGVMAGYSHFSGTALLGDGRVLLIVNVPELLSCR